MTIDYCYWKRDCKCHHARQAEKEALESYSQKQGKASTSSSVTASQSKAKTPLVASSTKNLPSKSSLSPASKKQPNTLQVDLSSKLASNGKLTSDKRKKHLKNNLFCLSLQENLTPSRIMANTPLASPSFLDTPLQSSDSAVSISASETSVSNSE